MMMMMMMMCDVGVQCVERLSNALHVSKPSPVASQLVSAVVRRPSTLLRVRHGRRELRTQPVAPGGRRSNVPRLRRPAFPSLRRRHQAILLSPERISHHQRKRRWLIWLFHAVLLSIIAYLVLLLVGCFFLDVSDPTSCLPHLLPEPREGSEPTRNIVECSLVPNVTAPLYSTRWTTIKTI